eukprot:CAMPEP_0114134282 /NCGR_PEP_ID=MMETSP0043_2-20121206/14071_1 /TAXON_ID=464988 /ORGANISM="Hemiselmis andersenii, Strain CCMP644" /LENGTH=181 /DNA_ID=CAMNT_0001227905 /DNA_START=901 /DNA_END=1443 /DNA_ORIENTATION=-
MDQIAKCMYNNLSDSRRRKRTATIHPDGPTLTTAWDRFPSALYVLLNRHFTVSVDGLRACSVASSQTRFIKSGVRTRTTSATASMLEQLRKLSSTLMLFGAFVSLTSSASLPLQTSCKKLPMRSPNSSISLSLFIPLSSPHVFAPKAVSFLAVRDPTPLTTLTSRGVRKSYASFDGSTVCW